MKKKDKIKNIVTQEELKLTKIKDRKDLKQLKTDFDVLLKIYEITEIKKELAYFSKLINEIDADKLVISHNLDKLFDLGLIYGDWNYTCQETMWVRSFHVEPDAMGLVKSLYNTQEDKKNITNKKENAFRQK